MTLDPKPIVDDEPAVEMQESEEPTGVPTTDDFVERVNGMTPGDITPQQILSVITAINHATTGDPVGTARRGPNGEFATRVNRQGVDMWQIVNPADGSLWYDFAPTLPWTQIGGN
ncbi:hypothetical protein [Mycolicibacterium bacteremicum]|uniref:hypothetical protein n=1 Tax=Mycolicibacterium bacteremicum TaxID=564198 RepID=UPI0009F2FE50|nr:hypothetical protein [Mycolicibacterium bacteremicum]MCV7434805.1 hypothetical protein [Mycolicibacterium bacteremicum]